MYVKFSPRNLNPGPYLFAPYKHLYLSNDHHAMDVQWLKVQKLELQ